ncbi:hypothetical protein OPU71_07010 [Niveibacterium sp. 24ML]|uniref:hypothetical protein n=1 Tax=Niveibacterium sp. 24ML TaxID=2985512 RepID=UPI0022705000|nr:hypothetical protein [Niveibacterium sp. 24ML]MCX9155877.1 hypothetical protein [Niveibacterium sp. 24ML]
MKYGRDDTYAAGNAAQLFSGIVAAIEMVDDLVSDFDCGLEEQRVGLQKQRLFALTSVIDAAARWGHFVCGDDPRLAWESAPVTAEINRDS